MRSIFLIIISFSLMSPQLLWAQWISSLPQEVQDSIYWLGDHEEGDLSDWTMDAWLYPGGGIFNTGGAEVEAAIDSVFVHSGNYSARASIENAWQAQNGSRAVRLMRWTNTAWDNGGGYFPRESYYSTFVYFPGIFNPNKYDPWDPGDGGWWNIFQFKSDDADGNSQPLWTLNVYHDDDSQTMSLYFYSKYNPPYSYDQIGPEILLPVGQWVHLEAWYKASDGPIPNGAVKLWQDGQLILKADSVMTTLEGEQVVWGIGNYTDHIDGGTAPGEATIYFDDGIVGTLPVHPYLDTMTSSIWGVHDFQAPAPLYPNPARDYIMLPFLPEQTIRLVSMHGQTYHIKAKNQKLCVGDLPAATYVLVHGQERWSFIKLP